MRALVLAVLMLGCMSAPTPRGISKTLDRCLTLLADWPLEQRCQCVTDARQRCVIAELPPTCYANEWDDQDHDAWTIGACRMRMASE